MSFRFGGALPSTPSPGNDTTLGSPDDTVSSLAWSPKPLEANGLSTHILAASTWDGHVLCYSVSGSEQRETLKLAAHHAPILDVAWDTNGTKCYTAACDNTVQSFSLDSPVPQMVAAHDAPVKFVRSVDVPVGGSLLVTGGWDGEVKWWDQRTPKPVEKVTLKGSVVAGDFKGTRGVACTVKQIYVWDVSQGLLPTVTDQTTTLAAISCASIMGDCSGYLTGSPEGRANVTRFPGAGNAREPDGFNFKCHRNQDTIFPVNCVGGVPGTSKMVSAGGDGIIIFWDISQRSKVSTMPTLPAPVTAVAFSNDCKHFAYASGYDWHKGVEHAKPTKNTDPSPSGDLKNTIRLRTLTLLDLGK